MALINRMSRLLTADIHAVLDRLEEPDVLLRQAIREMAAALEREERHVKRLEQERDAQAARRKKATAELADLDAQLDVCFDAGDEALARKLIRRKLEAERLGEHLDERLEAIGEELTERGVHIAERREQLDTMRQKAEILADDPRPCARAFGDDTGADRFAVGDDEVEIALLRERQRRKSS